MRRVLFWMHLSAGVLVGALILFFSITGALLAYERPIIHAADKRFYQPDSGPRLPIDEIVARAAQSLPPPWEMLSVHQDPQLAGGNPNRRPRRLFCEPAFWPRPGSGLPRAPGPSSSRSPPCIAGSVWPTRTTPAATAVKGSRGPAVSVSTRVRRRSLDAGPLGAPLRPWRYCAALRRGRAGHVTITGTK